jgi:solute carrier family 44 protein 1 (choline transporter-like protein)
MPSYSVPVLNRCVPRPVKELVFSVLNSWDTVEQVLGDLYATWREILGLTVLAFGKFMLLVLPVCIWMLLCQIC